MTTSEQNHRKSKGHGEQDLILFACQTIIEALPHPAMIINSDRKVLAANQIAQDVGAVVGDYCWKEFGKSAFLSCEYQKLAAESPDFPGIKCSFCLANETLYRQSKENDPNVQAFGRQLDTYWVAITKDIYLHYAIDITDHIQTTHALKESEERLSAALEANVDGLWDWDIQGGKTYFDANFYTMLGYAPNELPPSFEDFIERIHDEDQVAVKQAIKDHLSGVSPKYYIEFRFPRKDGGITWILSRGKVVNYDPSGNPLRLIGTHTDITERKKAEKKLIESEEKTRLILDSAAEAIYGLDHLGNCTFCNTSCLEMLGYQSENDLLGRNMHDLIHFKTKDGSLHPVEKCQIYTSFKTGQKVHLPNETLWKADGTSFPVELWSYPKIKNGEVTGAVTSFVDISDRLHIEEKLRLREEQYRNLVEETPDLVVRVDTEGRIIFVNYAAQNIYGLRPEECLGRSAFDFIHPDDRDATVASFNDWLRCPDNVLTYENRIVNIDGQRKYHMAWMILPERDESGSIIGFSSTARDITNQKRSEEALTKSIRDLQLAQRIANVGNWSLDPEVGVPEWSDEIYRILERKPAAGPYSLAEYKNLFKGEWFEQFNSAIQMAIHEGQPYDHELKIEFAPDHVKWVRAICEPERKAGSKKYFLRGTIQDITERQKAAEILRSKEEKFRTLFEHVTDYALVLRPQEDELVICDLSASACRIYGYTREELLDKPITVLDVNEVPPDDWRMQKIRAGETVQFEATHRRKDGSTLIVEAVVRMIEIDGEPLVFSIERDLTQKKQAEAERAELEKSLQQKFKMEAIGTLAGGIAHDFNNILAIILGSAEMLKRKIVDDESSRGKVEQILKASGRAKNLIEQVLAFSRQQEQTLQPILVVALIEETTDLLLATIPRTVTIRSNFAEGSDKFSVRADPVQLQQVLINLCSNAVFAMEEKGVIDITLCQASDSLPELTGRENSAGYLQLTVSDTGEGIAAKVIEKIFDPFYTTKDVGKGTGMGLAVVHGIIQSHNGIIQVESSPGEGSRFQILLPLTDDVAVEKAVEEEPLLTGTEKILVVDDEEDLGLWVEELLVQQGFKPIRFVDSQTALEHFNANPDAYDLLVTDQSMPGMSGVELIEQIRRVAPLLPVILCSGYSTRISEEILQKLNIGGFLQKPYRGLRLLKKIRFCLDNKTTR